MIIVEEYVASLGAFLKWDVVRSVKVYDSSSSKYVLSTIRSVIEEVKSTLTLESLKNHPVIKAYRDFYWRLGIDPTKVRPSSEALIRRVLRTSSIPLINNIVDLGNVASMKTMVPIGIYDLDRILPPLTLRRARERETFYPIGGRQEKLTNKDIVLVDSKGTVMHLFPHRDSIFTMVSMETKNILIIACGVRGVDEKRVQEAVYLASRLIEKSCKELE